jgi:hypothetical protein
MKGKRVGKGDRIDHFKPCRPIFDYANPCGLLSYLVVAEMGLLSASADHWLLVSVGAG